MEEKKLRHIFLGSNYYKITVIFLVTDYKNSYSKMDFKK